MWSEEPGYWGWKFMHPDRGQPPTLKCSMPWGLVEKLFGGYSSWI